MKRIPDLISDTFFLKAADFSLSEKATPTTELRSPCDVEYGISNQKQASSKLFVFRSSVTYRKTSLILLFVLSMLTVLFNGTTATAQPTTTVSGRVLDKNKEPLPGVSVLVTGSKTGTRTDADGRYSLKVPQNARLRFTYIGYSTQELSIAGKTQINITLAENVTQLDELVVIGYGTAKKRDLTGAVSSVSGKDIRSVPVTTAAQAITGKVAGVNVVTQSGAPGASINITVRGGTSITQGNSPLYIVDGFQMDDGLRNVDINDIESIDVMKDASATAIYGARGSNGVVLVTTKSGKSGKTQVSYNGYFSTERLGKKLDLLGIEDYVKYQYEFRVLAGTENQFANMFGGDINSADFYTGAYSRIQRDYSSRPGIDWQDEVFGGSALMQNHNVSITGGTEKTRFVVSYNNTGQDGIVAKSGYTRNNVRAKLNHEIRKGIRFDLNSNFNSQRIDGGGSLGGMLKMTILQPVTGGSRFTNEQLLGSDIGMILSETDGQYDIYNPIITNDAITKNKYSRQIVTNAGLDIDLLKDLTFRTAGSYTWQQIRDDMFDDGRTRTARNNLGPWGSRNNDEKYSWQITNTLNYRKSFGKHNLNAMVGQETYYSESMNLDNTYYRFPENNFGLNNVGMAETVFTYGSGKSRYGIVSVFGRAIYNYADKYLLTATVRGDGVSKFAVGNQWGLLPSFSAAWRLSEEKFVKKLNLFDNLKLRIGYGVTGNCDIDNNMYATDYGSGKIAINGKEVNTLVPGNTLGNRDLIWEKTKSTNIGLDLSVLKSRISLTAEYYNQEASNLLLKNRIPVSTGYQYQFQNIGSIRNRGFEFILNTRNINGRNFSWTTDLNMSFNKSLVKALYGSQGDNFISTYDSRVSFLIEQGKPLGQFYGYKYDGVYTTEDFTQNADGTYRLKDGIASLKGASRATIKPGDVKYLPTKGEADANGNPVWSTNDRSVIGSALPKFTGGINNTFMYKGFDLSVFMNFSYGNKVFNMNTQRFMGPYLADQNSTASMASRFVLVDPSTGQQTTNLNRLAALNPDQANKKQIWSINSANKIAISDPLDYYLEDGSFLRVNTVTLGYTLPGRIAKKAFLSNARIYATINNLHTFTNYTGYDPEVSATSSGLTRGIDDSAYPRAKSVVFGVNLTF